MKNHTRHQICKQTHKTTKQTIKDHKSARIARKYEDTKDKDRHDNF